MATPLGIKRGSSLNLRWSKCGVWWVYQWVLVSWLHIESSWVFTLDIDMLIVFVDHLDWGFWHSVSFCASLIYLFEILDMLITSIAYLALLSVVILTFAIIVLIALHVWIHCYIPFDSTYFDSLARILSRSSSSMIFVSLFIWLS